MFQQIAVAVFVFILFGKGDTAITGWTSPLTGTGSKVNVTGIVKAVDENTNGSLNVSFQATNAATYKIESQSPGGVFVINATSGVLSVSVGQTLNYEADTNYTLIVIAKATDNTTATASVTIPLNDVNEFTPAFKKPSYTVNVPNNSTKGTFVSTVTATDEDGSSTIKYTLAKDNNTGTDFAIDAKNGTITVANQLSAARTTNYALVVQAEDNGKTPLKGSTTVNVCVGCQSGQGVSYVSLMVIFSSVLFGIQIQM